MTAKLWATPLTSPVHDDPLADLLWLARMCVHTASVAAAAAAAALLLQPYLSTMSSVRL